MKAMRPNFNTALQQKVVQAGYTARELSLMQRGVQIRIRKGIKTLKLDNELVLKCHPDLKEQALRIRNKTLGILFFNLEQLDDYAYTEMLIEEG